MLTHPQGFAVGRALLCADWCCVSQPACLATSSPRAARLDQLHATADGIFRRFSLLSRRRSLIPSLSPALDSLPWRCCPAVAVALSCHAMPAGSLTPGNRGGVNGGDSRQKPARLGGLVGLDLVSLCKAVLGIQLAFAFLLGRSRQGGSARVYCSIGIGS